MFISKSEVLFNKLTSMISTKVLEEYIDFVDLIPEMQESGAGVETVNALLKLCLAGLFLKKYPNFKLVENPEEDTRDYWFVIRNEFVGEINKREYFNSLVKGKTVSEEFVEALINIRNKITLT